MAGIQAELQHYGVPVAQQEDLIAGIRAGESWDSLGGGSPVSIDQLTTGETVERFADGSIKVTQVETPTSAIEPAPGTVGPMAVTGCRALSNSAGWIRRADCRVRVSYAVIWMEFTADYSVKSGAGRVDAVRQASMGVTFGDYKGLKLSITRKLNSGSAPATARITATSWVGPIEQANVYKGTAWMQLNVLTSAWTTNN